jgi:hypothetical protein
LQGSKLGYRIPREGVIIFRDLVGKLDVLNVERKVK